MIVLNVFHIDKYKTEVIPELLEPDGSLSIFTNLSSDTVTLPYRGSAEDIRVDAYSNIVTYKIMCLFNADILRAELRIPLHTVTKTNIVYGVSDASIFSPDNTQILY